MPIKIAMEKLVQAPNIAKLLPKDELVKIGSEVVEGYTADRKSRQGWEERNVEAIKLALQVTEQKNFPWTNCANVKFPLVTVAALQFLARVSILTKGRQIVKCDVIGPDPQGVERARADRVQEHMSFQLVEEDTEWVNDDEKAKFAASIMGCAFKKSSFDPVAGINRSEYVPASHLVVDYHTKSFDRCNRVTHVLEMTSNDLKERERRGVFLKMDDKAESVPLENSLQEMADRVQGIERPADSASGAYEILEQHCWLDLDGDDYKEPYIVFVRSDTAQVLRIVARYFDQGDVHRVHDSGVARLLENAQTTSQPAAKQAYLNGAEQLKNSPDNLITRIDAQSFFTKYTFIPSIDGGFYDMGFGSLLGPTNKAVDTLINQQLDSGTMQVTAGGFLGRGVKIKGGKSSFDPFEWKQVDSQGDDLRKNIVPLPTNAPSTVLFQLLGLLIQYGEKISGSTDIMTGMNPGQNTPAETSRNTVEQGMMLFSGIYSRMHRSFKAELAKLYRLNQLFLETTQQYFLLANGTSAMIAQGDYKAGRYQVSPAADPSTVSQSQRQQKALLVHQMAMASPGFNTYLAARQVLEANDVQGIDQLLPDPKGPNAIPAPQNPELAIKQQELELKGKAHEVKVEEFQFSVQKSIFEMKQAVAMNQAKIEQLQAAATKLLAESNGVDVGHQIAIIEAQTGAARVHQDGLMGALDRLTTIGQIHQKNQELAAKAADGGVKPKADTPEKVQAATALQSTFPGMSGAPVVPQQPTQAPGAMNNGNDNSGGSPGMDQ
jgi:chaperonin GroES